MSRWNFGTSKRTGGSIPECIRVSCLSCHAKHTKSRRLNTFEISFLGSFLIVSYRVFTRTTQGNSPTSSRSPRQPHRDFLQDRQPEELPRAAEVAALLRHGGRCASCSRSVCAGSVAYGDLGFLGCRVGQSNTGHPRTRMDTLRQQGAFSESWDSDWLVPFVVLFCQSS